MKKIVALLFAIVMALSVCACEKTPAAVEEPTAAPATDAETPVAEPTAERPHFDKLTLEFVPSKDADVIIAGTANLPELVKAEMANLGYDIDEVDITVGTSYDATGEAMSAGSIDLGWLPGGTYALYSDDTDVILTATRNGLSNDSVNPADWNGEANATKKDGPQVTYYRSLIYAAPTEYGKKLAEKVNNGEALTWEDLDGARWAVQKTSSSAGYIYPSMWLMANYDGKKISDLTNVVPLDSGYGTAFSYAAAEQVDIIVCYADGRNDYEASWMLPTDRRTRRASRAWAAPIRFGTSSTSSASPKGSTTTPLRSLRPVSTIPPKSLKRSRTASSISSTPKRARRSSPSTAIPVMPRRPTLITTAHALL